jgi:tetratricopeptide (TPR) repeat protein
MNEKDRERLEPEFNHSLRLRDAGDLEGARTILERLANEFPSYPPILGTLASIHFLLDDYERALPLYRETVSLSPTSELALLGLFHSLWSTGRAEEAFNEMKRYLSISPSDKYAELLRELNTEVPEGE